MAKQDFHSASTTLFLFLLDLVKSKKSYSRNMIHSSVAVSMVNILKEMTVCFFKLYFIEYGS